MGRWNACSHKPAAGEWSRKQKRGYQRVHPLLCFWESHRFQVLWVTLSTAPGGNADKLTYHHKQLRQRIERHLGYEGLEYYQGRTREGNGVLHVFGHGAFLMANVGDSLGSRKSGFRHNGKRFTGLRGVWRDLYAQAKIFGIE